MTIKTIPEMTDVELFAVMVVQLLDLYWEEKAVPRELFEALLVGCECFLPEYPTQGVSGEAVRKEFMKRRTGNETA